MLDLRVGVGVALERIAADPKGAGIHQFADLPFADALVRFQVNRSVALLESDRDVLFGIGFAAAAMICFTPSRSTPMGFSQ